MKSKALLIAAALALAPGFALAQGQEHHQHGGAKTAIPGSLVAEHQELHHHLAALVKLPGETGKAAKGVEEALAVHFQKEEEYALPQLGALQDLAHGKVTPEMRSLVAMADKLKADLPHMLEEHKAVVAALDKLAAAGKAENRPEAVSFAEDLRHHARSEEEILYPASLLVGEYLRLRLGK